MHHFVNWFIPCFIIFVYYTTRQKVGPLATSRQLQVFAPRSPESPPVPSATCPGIGRSIVKPDRRAGILPASGRPSWSHRARA